MRVGFENNLMTGAGDLLADNAASVRLAAAIARAAGRPLATVAEARALVAAAPA
jgi:uncharacterized protein (DUF849 family)